MEVNKLIKNLVFNENSLSMNDLKQMINSGVISSKDLYSVLEKEIADTVISELQTRCEVPVGGTQERTDEHTEVFFWGMQGTGKTTIIGSLLNAGGTRVQPVHNTVEMNNRLRLLQNAFIPKETYSLLPDDLSNELEVLNIDIEENNHWKRKHPLTFIEVPEQYKGIKELEAMLNNSMDKIHFLCFDTADKDNEKDVQYFDKQISYLQDVLKDLKELGVFEHSVGIYILVTKIDGNPFIPPKERQLAAQTMITANQANFWYEIRQICHHMNIYDATPLPFTIGDVKLQKLVKVNNSMAENLIDKPILLKSHPYKSIMNTMLNFGNKWVTLLIYILVSCGIGYKLYKDSELLNEGPQATIKPYNFIEEFIKKEKSLIKDVTYQKSYSSFNELEAKLQTEAFLTQKDGSPLISADTVRLLGRALYNDFSKSVEIKAKNAFQSENWNANIKDLAWQCKRLKKGNYLTSEHERELDKIYNTIQEYYEAKNFISKKISCKSLAEVNDIKDEYLNFSLSEVRNDTIVRKGLENIVPKAQLSYARYLVDMAKQRYQQYKQALKNRSFTRQATDFFTNSTYNSHYRRANSLRQSVRDLKSTLNMNSSNDYVLDAIEQCNIAMNYLEFDR